MTGSNKILTVSYGTFSCTLEGFDDPFGTMRGIAEYFRDLAADDRYFGAEPPTPDVEMLQNIAQKEVKRRVEARVGDTGLALRQVDDEPLEAPVAEPEISNKTPAKEAVSTPEPIAEDAEVLESGPLAFDDDYLMADEPEDVLTVDVTATPAATVLPAESVAEKLRRIRAVVSRTIEPQEDTSAFDTAPDSEAGADTDDSPLHQRALSKTIAAITADLADEEDAIENTSDENPLTLSDDAAEKADTSMIASVVASDRDIDTPEYVSDNVVEEEVEAEVETVEEDIAKPTQAEAADDVFKVNDEDDDFDAALNAAIAKIAAKEETEISDDDPQPVTQAEASETFEDFEDDDVEDDFNDDEFEEDEPADIVIADAEVTEHKPSRPLEPLSDSDGNVGRLLQETDEKFNEGDGIRRRRVISQMRAAVAATKADRILSRIVSRDEQEVEEQNAYRQDLTRAMTRRPSFSEMTKAEAAARPAPLVLVSSQRVDETQTADEPTENTAPRRVSVSDDTMAEASNFREFAANMGATELPDLLEAAAAYTAFVEGQPHFSRPEIMKRVARVDPALEVSREAGLRSFGQLLRQGKIHKLQRGQFTVPASTRFNPTQRIAGE